MSTVQYRRVLLKLSGESLMGKDPFGINRDTIMQTARQIKEISDLGVEIAIVVGGGNIFRGVSAQAGSMDRATADYMGMLATVMNALALKDALESIGAKARVQSALAMQQIAETYTRPKAIQYLEEGKIVIFAAGTGNPFFTTDTAAALRGAEMGCNVMLKATNVDGIYTADPRTNPNATRYKSVTFAEAIDKKLKVMDATAFTLCQEQNLNIVVFDIHKENALRDVVQGKDEGTLVHNYPAKSSLHSEKQSAGCFLLPRNPCRCRANALPLTVYHFIPLLILIEGRHMISDIQKTAENKMQRSLEVLRENLAKVRTGRAHTGLLDQVTVEYWGSEVPVSQVGNVTLLDARTIGVKPFESNMAAKIEKAIRDSNLGLNPSSVGDLIRVPMPMLTEERRKDLIKVVRGEAEDGRVSIRNVRRDANDHVKKLLKDKEISEDEARRAEESVQKLTDKYIADVDKMLAAKEEDLMAI